MRKKGNKSSICASEVAVSRLHMRVLSIQKNPKEKDRNKSAWGEANVRRSLCAAPSRSSEDWTTENKQANRVYRAEEEGVDEIQPVPPSALSYKANKPQIHIIIVDDEADESLCEQALTRGKTMPNFEETIHKSAQRLGRITQIIYHCWDSFTRNIGSNSVEHMVNPCIFIPMYLFRFDVWRFKEMRYMSNKTAIVLPPRHCVPVLDEESAFPNLTKLIDHVDTLLRPLT